MEKARMRCRLETRCSPPGATGTGTWGRSEPSSARREAMKVSKASAREAGEEDGGRGKGDERAGGDVEARAPGVVHVRVRQAQGVGVDASLGTPAAVECHLELREDHARLLPADADALDLVPGEGVHHEALLRGRALGDGRHRGRRAEASTRRRAPRETRGGGATGGGRDIRARRGGARRCRTSHTPADGRGSPRASMCRPGRQASDTR